MKIALVNIGTLVSGVWRQPFIEGDSLLMSEGSLAAVGSVDSTDIDGADLVVDVGGMTVIPGLIDSHVHITFGDYTPRQKAVGFLESYLHGGITSCISASEIHVPGRPSDPAGVAALALAAQRSFQTYRPGGMRVYAGSVIMEPGLTEQHFQTLASEGVWLAKVGFGAFAKPVDVTPIVKAAQKHGFKVMCHTGGASIPGSQPITADDLLTMQPDIAGHCNGGPIALADEGLERVIKESQMALQIAQAGNIRSSALTVK
ncbi:MAG: amidohydrolase family protein, partial [Gammaproteobacteria bacterium]|nr:amidohydrolase family protein [Gammaproteobacteria bacterium]